MTEAAQHSGRLLAFEDAKLILVVDQLEELFVAGISPEDRRLFIQLLAGVARSGAVWVIATLRADFWHRAAEIPEFVALAEGQGRIDLAAPSGPELAEMISMPAQAAGLSFEAHPESGIRLDRILADDAAAAPGALPLLSFTLDELYKNANGRGEAVLTHASYEALGGLEGAIAKRADEIVAGLPAVAQAALPRVLRALTTVSEGADQAPVGRPAQLEAFPTGSPARILIDAFVAARLLVAASEGGSSPTVRLAHEALISRWKVARDQLATDRRDLETRNLIERQFRRWSDARGRERPLLILRNPDLANALDLLRRWDDELAAELRSFVASSDAAMKAATRRRWTVAAVVMVCLAGLAAASLGALYVAERQRNDALIAQSRFLARDSRAASETGNATLGALLALAALPRDLKNPTRPLARDAENALAYAFVREREKIVFAGHENGEFPLWDGPPIFHVLYRGALCCAVFSPDGTRIATGATDHTARLWDARTGAVVAVLHNRGILTSVAYSLDGSLLLTSSKEGTDRVWNANNGTLLKEHACCLLFLDNDTDLLVNSETGPALWNIATNETVRFDNSGRTYHQFGPISLSVDRTRLFSVLEEGSSGVIWDLIKHNAIGEIHAPSEITGATFSPHGDLLVTLQKNEVGLDDKSALLWDANSASQIAKLTGHEGAVTAVAFSPDNKIFATGSDDTTIRLWSRDGTSVAVLRGHEGSIQSLAFSPSGRFLVSASRDGTARIWDVKAKSDDDKLPVVLRGHASAVVSAVFSPIGHQILTASTDNTARLWDHYVRSMTLATIPGQQAPEFSPDGLRLITSSSDSTAKIWSTENAVNLATLRGHNSAVNSAVFSPDGKKALSASDDGTARLWDADTGQQGRVFNVGAKVEAAMFSPDGSRVITSTAKLLQFWDASTGTEIASYQTDILGAPGYDVPPLPTFLPDGRGVLLMENSKGMIFDGRTGSSLSTFDFQSKIDPLGEGQDRHRFYTTRVSPDGAYFSVNNAFLWDVQRNAEIKFHGDYVIFSTSGPRFISFFRAPRGNDDRYISGLEITDLKGMKLASIKFSRILWLPDFDLPLQISPDGTRILIANPRFGNVWLASVDERASVIQLPNNGIIVADSVFSPDGKFVLTITLDGAIHFFDAHTGALVGAIAAPEQDQAKLQSENNFDIRFAANSRRFVISLNRGITSRSVELWKLPLRCQELVDTASEAVPRELTIPEQAQFFLDRDAGTRASRLYTKFRPLVAWALPQAGDKCP